MALKGVKQTKEHRQKISKALKGHPMYKSKKRNEKISKALLGRFIASKYTKERNKKVSESNKGKIISKKIRKKIGEAHKGLKQSKETIEKRNLSRIGYKHSEETKQKIRKAHRKRFKNHIYKTDENTIQRKKPKYKVWREVVFTRDNWTCQKYGIRGGKLHPHHIKGFAQYPKLRFTVGNGVTLSEKAHKEFHKKYGYKNNTNKQLTQFLCLNGV